MRHSCWTQLSGAKHSEPSYKRFDASLFYLFILNMIRTWGDILPYGCMDDVDGKKLEAGLKLACRWFVVSWIVFFLVKVSMEGSPSVPPQDFLCYMFSYSAVHAYGSETRGLRVCKGFRIEESGNDPGFSSIYSLGREGPWILLFFRAGRTRDFSQYIL